MCDPVSLSGYCSAFPRETRKVRTVVNAIRMYDVASAVLRVLYV